jgi:hypothetical protein
MHKHDDKPAPSSQATALTNTAAGAWVRWRVAQKQRRSARLSERLQRTETGRGDERHVDAEAHSRPPI